MHSASDPATAVGPPVQLTLVKLQCWPWDREREVVPTAGIKVSGSWRKGPPNLLAWVPPRNEWPLPWNKVPIRPADAAKISGTIPHRH